MRGKQKLTDNFRKKTKKKKKIKQEKKKKKNFINAMNENGIY